MRSPIRRKLLATFRPEFARRYPQFIALDLPPGSPNIWEWRVAENLVLFVMLQPVSEGRVCRRDRVERGRRVSVAGRGGRVSPRRAWLARLPRRPHCAGDPELRIGTSHPKSPLRSCASLEALIVAREPRTSRPRPSMWCFPE